MMNSASGDAVDPGSERELELALLSSIYPTSKFQRVPGEFTGVGLVSPEITDGLVVQFGGKSQAGDGASTAEEITRLDSLQVNHLPEFVLNFQLPEDYPVECPPEYTLACKWLPPKQLQKICSKLDAMWSESRDAILYNWVQFLRCDALDLLDLDTDEAAQKPLLVVNVQQGSGSNNAAAAAKSNGQALSAQTASSLHQLRRSLREHDLAERANTFATGFHDCEVCFMTHSGSQSMQFLPCHHTYCNECMTSYFDVQISDGAVTSLTCPSADCESQALPTQVKALIPAEQYDKYERLLLQRGLESMEEIVLCPSRFCQKPVIRDSASSNMATCAVCRLSFCVLCKRTWHGVNPCAIGTKERARLVKLYSEGDSEVRAALEAKHGTRIKRYVEEAVSESWLHANSQSCPSCGCHIQKTAGCNKMACSRCRCTFCWLCSKQLNKGDPYAHFSDRQAPCFNRLFDGMLGLEDDADAFEDELDELERLQILELV